MAITTTVINRDYFPAGNHAYQYTIYINWLCGCKDHDISCLLVWSYCYSVVMLFRLTVKDNLFITQTCLLIQGYGGLFRCS